MMTTRLPSAVMKSASRIASPSHRLFWRVRYSIAKWMPTSSRPGTGRSRGWQAPPARTSASKTSRSSATGTLTPTLALVAKLTPSFSMSVRRRSRKRFSILNSGMPYRRSPPIRSARSKTVTAWPARLHCCAHASPAGPEPTTATRLPVRSTGGSRPTQPSSKACSMIESSIALIVTGSSLISSTHEPSHGAGQSRPVHSGKLFVACRRSIASRQWSLYTRSFQSGMMFPSGQPWWQNGMPQSIHRAACFLSSSWGKGRWTSFQSRIRSSTGRVGHFLRLISRKPVTLPTRRPDELGKRRLAPLGPRPRLGEEDASIVLRHHLDESGLEPDPVVEDAHGVGRARRGDVAPDQVAHELDVLGPIERLEVHHAEIAAPLEVAVHVERVRDPARHARGEVPAGEPEHDDAPAGHVLASVVADAFDDRVDAAVPHAEPLTGDAADVRFAAGRPVEGDVADDDVRLGHERGAARREDDQLAARQSLAPVVVGVPFQRERGPTREKGAEALTGGPREMDPDRVVRQPRASPPLGDVVAEHRAHRAIDVVDRQGEPHGLRVLDGLPAGRDDRRGVARLLQGMVLSPHAVPRDLGRHVRLIEDRREVEAPRLPVVERRREVELVGPADHLVHGPKSEARHVLANLLVHEP